MLDFDKQYRSMTDDELLNVARDSQHLRSEARNSLNGELSRRRITSAEVSKYKDEQTNDATDKRLNSDAAYLLWPALGTIRDTVREPMKAGAIISLIVAIGLGIAAIRNFAQDDERRHQAINRVLVEQAFNRALAVPDRDQENSALADVKRYEAEVNHDRRIGLAALVFVIAALVMFSTASHHVDAVPQEQQPNPPQPVNE